MSTNQKTRQLSVFIFVFMLIQTLNAQKKYLSGYIINEKGDTIHGKLDYRNWEINPESINFIEENTQNEKKYSPIEIKEFSVSNEIYKSAIIESEISPVKTDKLEYGTKLNIKKDTAFLQVLFRGNKSLFYRKMKSGKDNFYIHKQDDYELLGYKRYLTDSEGKHLIAENKSYIGQLTIYFLEQPSMREKINRTEYDKQSLYRLFEYYYSQSGKSADFIKKKDKFKYKLGIVAGFSTTNLDFHGENFEELVNGDYSSSQNFAGGIFFDIVFPRNQGRWSVYNELLISAYNFKDKTGDKENPDYYTVITSEIAYTYLNINNLLRYKYPIGGTFLFVNAGISNGIALKEKNYKKQEIKFYSTEKTEENDLIEDARKYEQGFILGLGTGYKNISIEVRYERGNGMSPYKYLNSLTGSYFFLLEYCF